MEKLVNLKIFKNVQDDARERLLFGIFTVFGAAIIITFRILNDLSVQSFFLNFVIALIAVAFIIIYGFINLKTLNLVGNALDRSSDNAYYLGLLYTLFSLLQQLKFKAKEQDLEIQTETTATKEEVAALGKAMLSGEDVRDKIQDLESSLKVIK